MLPQCRPPPKGTLCGRLGHNSTTLVASSALQRVLARQGNRQRIFSDSADERRYLPAAADGETRLPDAEPGRGRITLFLAVGGHDALGLPPPAAPFEEMATVLYQGDCGIEACRFALGADDEHGPMLEHEAYAESKTRPLSRRSVLAWCLAPDVRATNRGAETVARPERTSPSVGEVLRVEAATRPTCHKGLMHNWFYKHPNVEVTHAMFCGDVNMFENRRVAANLLVLRPVV